MDEYSPELGHGAEPRDLVQEDTPNAGDLRKLGVAITGLESLKSDPSRFNILFALQTYLLWRVCSRERMIRRIRKLESRLRPLLRSGTLDKPSAKRAMAVLRRCAARIDVAQHWIFLWKCFGDGAACVYQSPYNLKQLFYDKDYNVKEDSGFISGKAGFAREWEILQSGIAAGVPVVLSDLTNMIRTGDICALAAADPLPIEVKTGTASCARVARQQRNLLEVTSFFENDGAPLYRGHYNVARQELPDGPCYRDQINECISRALTAGLGVVTPEPGLHYVAATAFEQIEPTLDALLTPTTLVRALSPDPGWLPCLPFTLTLDRNNLIAFIARRVSALVLIDMAHLKTLFLEQGCHATMVMDGQCAIQLCIDPDDLMQGCVRISELLFARVGLEFQSLSWFARQHALRRVEPMPSMSVEQFEALPEGSYSMEIPASWKAVKDFFADAPSNSSDTSAVG